MNTTLPLRPKIRQIDVRAIHACITRDCPGELESLLDAHASAVSSAPSIEVYRRHHLVLSAFAGRHWIDMGQLRVTLQLIRNGTFSRTWPLVRTTE